MDDKQSSIYPKQLTEDVSFYDTLGISKKATSEEIKNAYYKLALQFHPDKNINDSKSRKKFQSINYAYSVLKNPEKKKFYDSYGSLGLHLFNHVGEDPAEILLNMKNPVIRVLLSLGYIITGYCFCYCCYCLCCYNFCCGLCVPREQIDTVESETEVQNENEGDNKSSGTVIDQQTNI